MFHEFILQIGNKDDMGAKDENGILARQVLDEYYRGFHEKSAVESVFGSPVFGRSNTISAH
ncbi:MAG: hypothetical protein V8Q17_00395 [Acutalibacteraceae bacterium]